MRQALTLSLSLLPCIVFAQGEERLAKLREGAEPLSGLGSFLEKYVGDCPPKALGGAECSQNAASFRAKANGKKFYMVVAEDSAVISMGGITSDGGFTLNVTPFFGAAGTALTHGAPSRTDASGNPVLPFLRVKGTAPDGLSADSIARMASMRTLRLEVVFTPQGLWTLQKKGGGKVTGVKGKIEAMWVTIGRTGQTIGHWPAR
ncbi:MAG: DUF6066 family protein [Myxococcota bacterium]